MTFRFPAAGHYTFDTNTTDGSDAFLWTDPLSTDQTLPQSSSTNRRWSWDSNDTPSTDIGPSSGEGGDPDGYVYNEMSSPGAFNDEFYMELDQTLDASANNIVVEFSTNQRGDNNNCECVIETNENGAGWVERGATFGGSLDPNKVATGGTQIWAQRSVDLFGLISNASTRIRIKLTVPASGTSWHNDYGIDRVAFIGTTAVTREQEGFRFYDDGTESGSTPAQTQDVDHETSAETTTQIRMLSDMVGDAPSEGIGLQYKRTTDGVGEWRFVPLTA